MNDTSPSAPADQPMTSAAVRTGILDMVRRDLIGPLPAAIAPGDADLAEERLERAPSHWYLTGFIAPALGPRSAAAAAPDDPAIQEESEALGGLFESDDLGGDANAPPAEDDPPPEAPAVRRRYDPSSIGLTVLLPVEVPRVEVHLSWGDYAAEPPVPESVLAPDGGGADEDAPRVDWLRRPRDAIVTLAVPQTGKAPPVAVPNSAPPQRPGCGWLELAAHARELTLDEPDRPPRRVRALTVFLVNRRHEARRSYADIAYAFQARMELRCAEGFVPRRNLSGYRADDDDLRIADLHYRDAAEYAVGRNTAADWAAPDADGRVLAVWTEPLPTAEVERVAPNEEIPADAVAFGMEALADAAEAGGPALLGRLGGLPDLYAGWIDTQRRLLAGLPGRRQETARRLIEAMTCARDRIAGGVALLGRDERARTAFRVMNLAVARAARRRFAGPGGDPAAQRPPSWRPFQLAFILLNLDGLVERTHPEREIVDLLFFPTGGGKTEAYLGLAAFAIAHRRLCAGGLLGAGVTVIMRYTLRLLTLDQLSRAAGVVCALELMRSGDEVLDGAGNRRLGDWPIEIGLWVGSDASPNILGGTGRTGDHTAVTRVRRFKKDGKHAPAPIKTCPWCATPFGKRSFELKPTESAPQNMTITCANPRCDFVRGRTLPIVTVDQAIYRRLPAFLIATVDKFAGLPWIGPAGAFFGHADRFEPGVGFYGAAEPGQGTPLFNDHCLDPPDLIIQDELHLISGPLGTVAGLYETAIDRLSTRRRGGERSRPKIVASTATVRRAHTQIKALFDRDRTHVFPPPGVNRTDSWFARTQSSSLAPARLYVGLAAQGRGPRLVFMRGLISLMSAAKHWFDRNAVPGQADNPADPYLTALCYFNALRELGGARRIVEDEVADRLSRYGAVRQRGTPSGAVFADRRVAEPLELTSRVSTDDVALAKKRLEAPFTDGTGQQVDVALATNMISVGLDILRLGLMVVQGQPKTAAEYIQATSRVGRRPDKPGLVVTVLNLHKPRDRAHYESFRLFHETFYRAVEATSVTPWAARSLDRSLPALVVAVARHLDPDLTPERAVSRMRSLPGYRDRVIEAIVARAPEDGVVGGKAALRAQIESLLDDWDAIVDKIQSQLSYTHHGGPHHLLYAPLDPALANLVGDERSRFVAARSMRDVEPNVLLKVRDPFGRTLDAEDV